jgi:hypothetical protein
MMRLPQSGNFSDRCFILWLTSPLNVRSAAGINFRQYGIAHGGLGVWDKTTDYKFSIEYTSESYVGAVIRVCT